MTVQIAIRMPDDMVALLDKSVAAGNAPSRAALVARAVEREMHRQVAEKDAAILRHKGPGMTSTIWSSGPSHAHRPRTDRARSLPGATRQDPARAHPHK